MDSIHPMQEFTLPISSEGIIFASIERGTIIKAPDNSVIVGPKQCTPIMKCLQNHFKALNDLLANSPNHMIKPEVATINTSVATILLTQETIPFCASESFIFPSRMPILIILPMKPVKHIKIKNKQEAII